MKHCISSRMYGGTAHTYMLTYILVQIDKCIVRGFGEARVRAADSAEHAALSHFKNGG